MIVSEDDIREQLKDGRLKVEGIRRWNGCEWWVVRNAYNRIDHMLLPPGWREDAEYTSIFKSE